LSRAAALAPGRLDHGGLGHFGQQSTRKILPAHRGGTAQTDGGNIALGPFRAGGHWRFAPGGNRGRRMTWRRTLSKVRFLLWRRPDDLAEEIRTHLAMEEAENAAVGMGLEDARDQARRRFGNVTSAAERSRDMWTWT